LMVPRRGGLISRGTPEGLTARAGAQMLELRTVRPARLPRATRSIEAITSTPATSDGLVTGVPVGDAAVLPEVVRRLDEQGVVVGELSLRKPSLDEVFLALTGSTTKSRNEEIRA